MAQRGNANEAFCEALRRSPSWRPDPTLYTGDELDAFARAQERCGPARDGDEAPGPQAMPPRPSASSRWYKRPAVLALGAAAVGGALYLLLQGEETAEGRPEVPGFPPPAG